MTRNMKRMIARLILIILTAIVAVLVIAHVSTPCNTQEPLIGVRNASTHSFSETAEIQENYENQKIEAALLKRSHKIENCTVTWYTADTCGKKSSNPSYGITYSGLPVVENQTCAVDTDVIPLYSDVFVQYADGSIEQLWATDTGVAGNAVDIYTPDYDYAIHCGRQSLTVWWVEPVTDYE